jgi:dolichol-phosphate mannosyltransferase
MSSLSILVPALNEEQKLAITVNELLAVARSTLNSFEMILIDDGSSDQTGAIADSLALENADLFVIHNPVRRGLGYVFRESMARARCDKLMLIPGDHAYNAESLRSILESIDQADLLIGTRTNQTKARSALRVRVSQTYNQVVSLLFGFKLKDFHGPIVFPVNALRQLDLKVIGYTFQIEALIKLLRRNHSFLERPVTLNAEHPGSSRSLRWSTFWDLVRAITHLLTSK